MTIDGAWEKNYRSRRRTLDIGPNLECTPLRIKLNDQGSGVRSIGGPGVWISCIKGKEKQTVGELYDLFESLGSELWPTAAKEEDDKVPETETPETLETQIANEISAIKRPRVEARFVVFISCKSPVDPVELVETHIQNVQKTGVSRTRYTHRFVPVSETCYTSIPDIQRLTQKILSQYFERHPEDKDLTYKVELRVRSHTSLTRPTIIQAIADCVPTSLKVDLTDPKLFVLVEIFKSVCGIAITKDYYQLLKYNVMEIAKHESVKD
ncbi:trna acetyltransferase [Moniliophthora roreri]|nr:trna acetyltransferase [Moniliophthora roreri]